MYNKRLIQTWHKSLMWGGQVQPRQLNQAVTPTQNIAAGSTIQQAMTQQALNPGLPTGAINVPVGTQVTQGQLIGSTSGQLTGPQAAVPTAMAGTQTASQQGATQAGQMQPATSASGVAATQAQAAQGAATGTQSCTTISPTTCTIKSTSCTRSGYTDTRCAYTTDATG